MGDMVLSFGVEYKIIQLICQSVDSVQNVCLDILSKYLDIQIGLLHGQTKILQQSQQ